MKVSVSAAKAHLTDLVRRAEAGDEVILTRRGRDVARLVPIGAAQDATSRRALMERVRASRSGMASPGPTRRAARTLCGKDGLG